MFKKIAALFTVLALASCTVSEVKPASEFKQNWESANKNSAVSWWYFGETETSYFITEKFPLKHTSYEVPKTLITLEGVPQMEPCKSCKGFNLKYEHVVYTE